MENVVSATQARLHFGKLIRQVQSGEVVVVEHGGKPAVVVLAVEEYLRLKAKQKQGWRETLERLLKLNARLKARQGGNWLTAPPAEVIQEIRDERDAQLDNMR